MISKYRITQMVMSGLFLIKKNFTTLVGNTGSFTAKIVGSRISVVNMSNHRVFTTLATKSRLAKLIIHVHFKGLQSVDQVTNVSRAEMCGCHELLEMIGICRND